MMNSEHEEWITEGYEPWLKRSHRKSSKEQLYKYIGKRYLKQGIDLNRATSLPIIAKELFWQSHCLKIVFHVMIQLMQKRKK